MRVQIIGEIARIGMLAILGWVIGSLAAVSIAHGAEPKQNIETYITARTAKVCALYRGGMKCGTGQFVGRNTVMTQAHIISPVVYPNEAGLIVSEEPAAIAVLLSGEQEFSSAVLVSSSAGRDYAILTVPGAVSPQVIMSDEFERGDSVWVIGNPGGRDFTIVRTTVTGVQLDRNGDGVHINMIELDSKNGAITHGFSGGGVFTRDGMIGTVEQCSDEERTCLAIPAGELKKNIERTKK